MAAAREIIPLNGEWGIAAGTLSGPPPQWTSRIRVPSLVDTAIPSYDWRAAEYHWYRTAFSLMPSDPRQRVTLVLEQAMFGTEVRVNNLVAGRDIACYTSQEYDITAALHRGGENELLVRVGRRDTLPPESAVGKDQEREVFVPGIWGDVRVVRTGDPRIRRVQVIPRIGEQAAEVRVLLRNAGKDAHDVRCHCRVMTHEARDGASVRVSTAASLAAGTECVVTVLVEIPDVRLWSPEDPFLYDLDTEVESDGQAQDRLTTTFGMREFRVDGGDFLLNGKKILLRGGNIAFHRFLSDETRSLLPWDMEWAKRILIDIPRAHHFNFFRIHLGQMYNRWYDLADRHGILIQNEWPFWTRSGSEDQIRQEFTRWLEDNWNHPSIVAWDPMNESYDEFVAGELITDMKALDPTRPWEMRDFVDEHPYIYSLGPVMTGARFGFSRSMEEIERSSAPSVVNEFLWWWLDPDDEPTLLTRDVLERWMGPRPERAEIVAHQSFLAAELIELFRRMRVDAIQPFVYLSNGRGPTGHWFLGNPADLRPKPVLAAIRNAFSPFGVSVELWDRHFTPGERRAVNIHIFNDREGPRSGTLRWGVVEAGEPGGADAVAARSGGGADTADLWIGKTEYRMEVSVAGVDSLVVPVEIAFPEEPGRYEVRAELADGGPSARHGSAGASNAPAAPLATPHGAVTRSGAGTGAVGQAAVSRKRAHVIGTPTVSERLQRLHPGVLEERGEILHYLRSVGIEARDLGSSKCSECDAILVADGLARGSAFQRHITELESYLATGGSVVLIEPEYGVETEATVPVGLGISFHIVRRADADRGGYDSYVFMDDPSHPLWRGIRQDHLQFFNGAPGGEIVSQHDITCTVPMGVLARCGLKCGTVAAAEVEAGAGFIVLSRLQIRGRLVASRESGTLYGRRPDPVAQQYLMNLLETYGRRRETT